MKPFDKHAFEVEFTNRYGKFLQLNQRVDQLLHDALFRRDVPHLQLQSRVKEAESASQKAERKLYSSPFDEMTDIVAVRVIVYLDSEINAVREIVEELFEIDSENSVDKRQPRQTDVVGYRSLHLVCKLGQRRESLAEYAGICDISFEVQIRTVLEHAWAEIEHKQNYKSKKALPKDLQRRLMVVAGALELVDKELSNIAADALDYADLVSADTAETSDDLLSEASLAAIVKKFVKEHKIPLSSNPTGNTGLDRLISELNEFGVFSVGEARQLLERQKDRLLRLKRDETDTTYGLVRDAMMVEDFRRYFETAYDGSFCMSEVEIEDLAEVLSVRGLRTHLENLGVEVVPGR